MLFALLALSASLAFSLNLQANGTYSQCQPPSFYEELNITPGHRSELRPIHFTRADWDSQFISSDILSIILREAMGFNGDWVFESNSLDRFAKLADQRIDIATEAWTSPGGNYPLEIIEFGSAGYSGNEAIFVSNSLTNASRFILPEIQKLQMNCGDNHNCLDRYIFHQVQEVYEYLSTFDSIVYISENRNGIKDEIINTCSGESSFSAGVPRSMFLPPKCAPIPREAHHANITYPKEFEEVEILLHTGEKVYLNKSTHVLPPCSIWHDVKQTWHENQNQALLVNLEIPSRVYWWGMCRLQIIITHFINNNLPIMFYWWVPEVLTAGISNRISVYQFAPAKDGCYENNVTNRIGYSSENTCGFVPADNLETYGSVFWLKAQTWDAVELFTKFSISLNEMNNMILEVARRKEDLNRVDRDSGKAQAMVACDWITKNTDTWTKWIPSIQYQREVVVLASETSGMSTAQNVILIIACLVLFFLGSGYVAQKKHWLDFLNDISSDMIDLAATKAATMIFLCVDLSTDWLCYIFVINNSDNVSFLFSASYVVFLVLSSIIAIYVFYHGCHNIYEIISKRKEAANRITLSFDKHAEKIRNIRTKGIRDSLLSVAFEDFPFLVMNLYFIFAIEKDIQVMNVLAIVTTCLALGAKGNSIVMTRRLFKTEKKRDKHKKKIVMTHGRQSFRKNNTSIEDSSDELTFETGGDEFDDDGYARRDPSFLKAPSFGL